MSYQTRRQTKIQIWLRECQPAVTCALNLGAQLYLFKEQEFIHHRHLWTIISTLNELCGRVY